jgi:VCBS repeat-containing protein
MPAGEQLGRQQHVLGRHRHGERAGERTALSFNGSVAATAQGVSGTKALYLQSSGNIQFGDQNSPGRFQPDGYGSIHGPYATSTVFSAEAGDSLSLEFKAVGSGDDYEVFGLLRRVDGSGNFVSNSTPSNSTSADNIILFAQRGADTGGFVTVTKTGLVAGDYRFEFVGGTYDGSGGLFVGSNLYIDNIRLISATTVNDSIAQTIARQVQYQNTGTDSLVSRTLTVTAVAGDGSSTSANSTLSITQVNNPPSFTSGTTLTAVPEDTASPAGATVATLFNSRFSDPDTAYTPADTLAGVAITADASVSATQGVWQYTTDGSTWFDVGTVSTSAALLLPSNSLLRFLPAANYHGTPGSLTVHAVDSSGGLTFTSGSTRSTFDTTSDGSTSAVSAAGVTLGTSITSVNDAPTFTSGAVTGSMADTAAADTYSSLTGTFTGNDVDGDGITWNITGGTLNAGVYTRVGTYGTLTVNATTGAYTYVPNPAAINALTGGSASDTFTINATDGALSTGQTFTVNVSGTNDTPIGVDDTGNASESGGVGNGSGGADASGDVLANDSDADTGSSFTVSSVRTGDVEGSGTGGTLGTILAGQYGFLTLDADGTYTYTVDETDPEVQALLGGQTLEDAFNYTVTDNVGATDMAVLRLTIASSNDAPIARPDFVTAIEDGAAVAGNVLANDTELDVGDTATVTNPGTFTGAYGTLTIDADGDYVYSVHHSLAQIQALRSMATQLKDTFSYTMRDSAGAASTAVLTVRIAGSNDAPTISVSMAPIVATEDSALSYVLPVSGISDVDDGDTLTFEATLANGDPLPGWLSLDPVTGRLSGTPVNEDVGTVQLRITARDGGGGSVSQAVELSVLNVNDAPEFRSPAGMDLAENLTDLPPITAIDVDGDVVTFSLTGGADLALFTIDPLTGNLRFREAPDFETPRDAGGDNSYEIEVGASDGNGGLTKRVFTIQIRNMDENAGGGTDDELLDDDDDDNDGIPDTEEGDIDSDDDGVVDRLDDDSDDDGRSDSSEADRDSDGDGRSDTIESDDDNDGTPSSIESVVSGLAGNGAGDGNGDNIDDARQQHVSSLQLTEAAAPGNGGSATLQAHTATGAEPAPGSIDDPLLVRLSNSAAPADLPEGLSMPYGQFDFLARIPTAGGTQSFSLFVPDDEVINGYWKQDNTGEWHDISTEIVHGEGFYKVSFSITDGGVFDEDGVANGFILNPGAPGFMDDAGNGSGGGMIAIHELLSVAANGRVLQLLTPSESEKTAVDALPGWTYDGVAFQAPGQDDGASVWRFFHHETGDHFYTMNVAERDGLIAGGYGYSYEGEGFRALSEAADGAMAVHRFFNGEAGGHLYTTSESMTTELVGEGYVYEGILGYVFA